MSEMTDGHSTPMIMQRDIQFLDNCSADSSLPDPEPGNTEFMHHALCPKDNGAALVSGPLTAFKKERVDEVEDRYDELHKRWLEQQDELGRAQDEIIRLRNQVMHQSTFCASLGAVLGNLVWQSSRFPQVIDMWLSKSKIGEFLCIVNGTFVSFINTYGSVFPSENSDESQFVMGLCGIVTNLSASPEGRQFLVTHQNGKDLLQKIVKLMPLIPLPTGRSLARLILMTLYNVSINQAGLQYLLELQVCRVLSQYIDDSAAVELKQLSLRLLQSITFELQDESTMNDILTTVTADRIEKLARTGMETVAATAKEVLTNLKKSQSFIEQKGRGCIRKDADSQRYEAKTNLLKNFYAQSNKQTKNLNVNN